MEREVHRERNILVDESFLSATSVQTSQDKHHLIYQEAEALLPKHDYVFPLNISRINKKQKIFKKIKLKGKKI